MLRKVCFRVISFDRGGCYRLASTTSSPVPRESSQAASFKKGTGGRSSFSGNVCTVFGATGFTGRYIVNRLGKEGTQIIIPYRSEAYYARDLKLAGDLGQVLFLPFHLKDEDSIRRALKYSNVVINLIGSDFETRSFPFDAVHIDGARRIARLSREAGVTQLIHVSAMNASLEPPEHFIPGGSMFLRTKAMGEKVVREEFPDAVIIRPGCLYGEEDRFTKTYLDSWMRRYLYKIDMYRRGDETYKMPVSVSDFASGVMKVLRDPTSAGQTYEFVGPHCYLIGDLVDFMTRFCNFGENLASYTRLHWGPYSSFKANLNEARQWLWKESCQFDWELMERMEVTSDVLTGAPTLADLGINLKVFEYHVQELLWHYDRIGYYHPKLNEFGEVPFPPRRTPLRRAGVQQGYDMDTMGDFRTFKAKEPPEPEANTAQWAREARTQRGWTDQVDKDQVDKNW